jgi:hypothetical protein
MKVTILRVSQAGKKYLNSKHLHLVQEDNLVAANNLLPNHYFYSERKKYSQNFTHKILIEKEMNLEKMVQMKLT